MKHALLFFAWIPVLSGGCQKHNSKTAEPKEPVSVPVVPGIPEASGIADSKSHPNALWVIEDSDNPPQLILLGHDGKVQQKLDVQGATNRDWEEVVLSGSQLYIGDIGDNAQTHASYKIYRMPEPATGATEISAFETIRFRYSDGSHDAEAFLVDPKTGDIYVITKRDAASTVFKIAYPYSLTEINVAEKTGELSFAGVVSASLAPDGSQILVKTYDAIYSFPRLNKEPLSAALKRTPSQVPYQKEPQGEAVCYKLDQSGYFTLSEQLLGFPAKLYFYGK